MTTENAQPQVGTAQCSVTGRWVPEDELVTINGQRVCAEGKAILLDRLKAGEGMPGELEKPTVLRRFGALFVDGLLLGLPMGIANAVFTAGLTDASTAAVYTGVFTLLSSIVYIVYFGAMHGNRGQTVGKMAAKIRVVRNDDGAPISSGTAFLRAFAYYGPNLLAGLVYLTGNLALGGIVGMVFGLWALADVIFALVDRDRQRSLHDRIAGTRVIDIH